MRISPLRQAAIRLACVHAEDRQWILGQLRPEQREQLEVLLEEIADLGLANDPAVVNALLWKIQSQSEDHEAPALEAPENAWIDKAEDPFWAALALQLLPADQRHSRLQAQPNGSLLGRWNSTLDNTQVPPTLASALRQHLQQAEEDSA